MGFLSKGGKPTYTNLSEPTFDTWPMPDAKVLRRDGPVVNTIVKTVQEQVMRIGPDGSHLSSQLGELQDGLTVAFTSTGPSQEDTLKPVLTLTCHMGYLLGVMENESGVGVAGFSESHYWTALAMLVTKLPIMESNTDMTALLFSIQAAYCVARQGQQAIHPTLAAAAVWAMKQR